jgi:hypothetical protein
MYKYINHKCIRLCTADIVMSSKEGMQMNLRGTVEGERGGGEGEKGSVYCQPGSRMDGIRTTAQERDFQVSKMGLTVLQADKGRKTFPVPLTGTPGNGRFLPIHLHI